jgi:hypothetical protein
MWRRTRLLFLLFGAGLPLVLMSSPAEAYMGPGGGFTLLTMGLGMLAVFSASLLYFLSWPVRATKRWLQRRRDSKAEAERKPDEPHPEEKR